MVDVRVEVTAELQLGKEETALGMKNGPIRYTRLVKMTESR